MLTSILRIERHNPNEMDTLISAGVVNPAGAAGGATATDVSLGA
ncbi:MAG: hypothetical protein OXT74_18645 [Candidatus Poribacteria bacterium]|nr:hypothetical protein [Candidatus Poribacteria bacterium]